jgi:integrase
MFLRGSKASVWGVVRMLDTTFRIIADEERGGRVSRKGFMTRRRYQVGCLFIRGKKRKVWVARWREDVIQPDGTLGRVLRSEVLGLVAQIPTRREARELLQTRLTPINQGRHRPQSTMTFGAFVEEQFRTAVVPTLKFSTRRGYDSLLKKHLLPRFRTQRLCDFTRPEIQRFILEKLQKGYAWEMGKRVIGLLSKILATAVEWGYLTENPARGVKMPERTLKRPHNPITADEVQKLLFALNEPERTFALIAVLTGLRLGELLALRWGRVDFVGAVLRVEESCYMGRFGTPKTRSSRRAVALSPSAINALVAHRSRCIHTSTESLVFCTRDGEPRKADQLRDSLKQACRQAGVREIDFHTLRHTHSTLLHATGAPLKVAQAQLGHSSAAMTLEVYTHALPDAQQQAVAKIDEVLFPNVPNSGADGAPGVGQTTRIQ